MGDSVPVNLEEKKDPFIICSMKCYHLLGIRLNDKVSEERKKRFQECMDKCMAEELTDDILDAYAEIALGS